MMVFMLIVSVLVFVLLVLVAGVIPKRSALTLFELERRSNSHNEMAQTALHREHLIGDVLSLQRITQALLLVLFVALSVATFGWFMGVLLSVVIALEYGAIARLSIVATRSQKLYEQYETDLLHFVERFGGVFRFVRIAVPKTIQSKQLDSREELLHMVDQSGALLSSDEKKVISQSLEFNNRTVKEIMTPRGVIDSINVSELLGPLVLDDLHKTGHSRFPVIDGDVDHIVGMLYIQNLLTLGNDKKSMVVDKAMEARVFYVHEDQTLQHALAAFLRTHHHLFVVVNEFRETVGLLSLEDVIETLIGHKIVDEFDAHDDLRAVAMRNPRGNNRPAKREDV
jgi:CBS domain containing-hemolysin-like protein